jgi:hypothetical protein
LQIQLRLHPILLVANISEFILTLAQPLDVVCVKKRLVLGTNKHFGPHIGVKQLLGRH